MLEKNRSPPVMLSFSIVDNRNISEWCRGLSSVLESQQIKATVFVTGRVAERYPDCVASLVSIDGVDMGSQTYSYVDLADEEDYLRAQAEVKQGKLAVDRAGNVDSRLFRAPFGSTDQNIYSLLSNSNITADFSYKSQYNKYEDGQFVKYDLVTCECNNLSLNEVKKLLELGRPVAIEFDNRMSISEFDNFVAALKSDGKIQLVNASDLTGLQLTVKGGVAA